MATIKMLNENGVWEFVQLAGEDVASLREDVDANTASLVQKAYYYNTVSDMKASNKLKLGDYVMTLGFYAANDGGRAKYQVISNTGTAGNDITLFDLPNTLQAKLLQSGSVRAEQIGIQGGINFNNTPFVIQAIKDGIKDIYFRSVEYQFDELLISYPSTNVANINLKLHGGSEITYNEGGYKSTLFTPYRTGQKFIVKFGGDANFTVANAALTWDVYNSGLINIALSDSGKAVTNACLALEYVYSSVFSIAFFYTEGRSIYIKNMWESDIERLIIRYTKKGKSAVYIDDALSDGSSNTSSMFFKEVYLESLSDTFLESTNGSIGANIVMDSVMYEHNFTNSYTNGSLPTSATTFNSLTKIPLFNLGQMDGLTIGQMNLAGMSKTSFTDGTTNFIDSIFNFKGFFNVTVGIININDAGAFIQVASGVGAPLSILKVNGVTSSLKNRLYNAQTTTNLLMLHNVTTGGVVLPDDMSFKEKDDLQYAVPGMYKKERLLKLCAGTKTDYTLLYDDTSINGSVFARTALSFQTLFKWKITVPTLKLHVRIKTDNSSISIGYYDASGTNLSTDTHPITGDANNYQEFDYTVTKGTNVDSFRFIVPQGGTVCKVDYIYISI